MPALTTSCPQPPARRLPNLDRPEGASLFYEVKVAIADKDFQVMAEAGVDVVQPGIEALATSTRKLMAKHTTSFLNLQYDVNPICHLLIGFPARRRTFTASTRRTSPC